MAGTSPERVRQTVVLAAIPLLAEYPTLTMERIAGAAGVGEAELVAVFPDKDAVVQACIETMTAQMSAAWDPTEEIRQLAAIRVAQPLASRLVEVLGVVDAYHRRVRADMRAFEDAVATGDARGVRESDRADLRFLGRQPELRQAVVRLLEPDAPRLRLPPEAVADAFLAMSQALPAAQVVDLFLHGALVAG